MNNKKKIFTSYVFVLLILAIGWCFFYRFSRKTFTEYDFIEELDQRIDKQRFFFLNINLDKEKLENYSKQLLNVFQNQKLASNYIICTSLNC